MNANLSPKFLAPCAALVALLAVANLSGCADARRTMGLEKAPPDEFAVVANAPLSQPPDYSLHPPVPGAPRPQEGTTTDQAHDALTGGHSAAVAPPSAGELAVLAKAGTSHNIPDIRRKVDEETTGFAVTDDSFVDKLLFWRDAPEPGEPMNSVQEAERLKANKATGKPPADGDNTISIQISRTPPSAPQSPDSDKGWFSWLF